jgi:hypothetical protein
VRIIKSSALLGVFVEALLAVLYTGQVTTVVRGAVRLHIYDWQSKSKGMV